MRLPAVFCLLLCSFASFAEPTRHPAPARVVLRSGDLQFVSEVFAARFVSGDFSTLSQVDRGY